MKYETNMFRKMSASRFVLIASLVLAGLASSADLCAQGCKRFTQKNCLPGLEPYVNNGQINSTTLFEGDSASLRMTFYSLLDYRLMICSHPILGENVRFRVKDVDGDELYNSEGSEKDSWDFRVNSTQELIIDVVVPEDASNPSEIPPSGCVSVVLGFKE